MEERIAKIEGTIEQMDKRLDHLESEILELRKENRDNFRRNCDNVPRREKKH